MASISSKGLSEKSILLETKKGAIIRMSKREKAILRRRCGLVGSVDGVALVRAALGYLLQNQQDEINSNNF